MTPEQRLQQAVRFADMHSRTDPPGGIQFWLTWWLDTKSFAPEDANAIRGYVARLMAGEDPEQMIVTSLEQAGEAA